MSVQPAELARGGPSPKFCSDSVQISAEQFLDAHDHPIILVLKPGVGKFVDVLGFDIEVRFRSTPYTPGASNFLYVSYDGPGIDTPIFSMPQANVIDQSQDMVQTSAGAYSSIGLSANVRDWFENRNVVFYIPAGGNPTGGDADIFITTQYAIGELF